MNNVFNKVFQNSIFFTLGILATKAISFLMLPVYTHFMTESEYGMASTINSFIGTFSLLVLLGLRAAIMRFYPGIEDAEKKKKFAGNVLTIIVLNGAAVLILACLGQNFLLKHMFVNMEFFPMVFLGVAALIAEALYYASQSFLQSEQKGKQYALNSMYYMLLYAGLNLVLIVVFRMGALGMTISLFAAPLIIGLKSILKMKKAGLIAFGLDRKIMLPILKYSLPIVPHDVSSMLAHYISNVFMNTSVSYAATGRYTVASQISSILGLVQGSLNLAFHPWFNEQMDKGQEGRKNIKTFSIFIFAVYCYFSIGIAFFSPEILSVMTPPEYADCWQLVPLLTLALVINFIYYAHVLTIFYNVKASKFIAVCSVTGSLSDIFLSYFLIARIASWGAAIAYFIARCITALITVLYSRRVQKVDFGLPQMCIMAVATAAMMIAGLAYGYCNRIQGFDLVNIAIKAAILLVIAAVVFLAKRHTIMPYIKLILKR